MALIQVSFRKPGQQTPTPVPLRDGDDLTLAEFADEIMGIQDTGNMVFTVGDRDMALDYIVQDGDVITATTKKNKNG